MNSDGRTDVVTANPMVHAGGVHAQAPDRTLDPVRQYPLPFQGSSDLPDHLAVGDVSGDGRPDVVVAVDASGVVVLRLDYIKVFTQTLAGTLSPPATYPSWQPEPVRVGDVNADGRGDLVTVYGGS